MVALLILAGFAVLLYSGFTAWDGDRLRLSSLLMSVGGWALIAAAVILMLHGYHV